MLLGDVSRRVNSSVRPLVIMGKRQRKLNQVFICYRRENSSWVAGRIYDRLSQKFGRDVIFKDIDSIPLGINFKQHIESVVQQCSVVLVIVYHRWMGESAESGKSRIDDPNDFVRIEIESALSREIPIIPLFIEDAVIPSENDLPETMKGLVARHGMKVNNDPYFHRDMDRLINHLEPILQFKKSDLATLKKLRKFATIFFGSLTLILLIAAAKTLLFK